MSKKSVMKVMAEEGVGIPGFFHYDPYFHRYKEHVKQLLTEGNPIIVRLHPGEYYPMSDDALHYRVDREGHVVAIVGYDDEDETFILADPWNKEMGGERTGIYKMPYPQFGHENVDGTLDAMTVPIPWDMKIEYPDNPDGEFTLKAEITYSAPAPLSKSYYHLHDCHAKINLPQGLDLVDEEIKQLGELGTLAPGETVSIEWKVEATNEIISEEISLQARGIVSSEDPYTYSDVIGNKGVTSISLVPKKVLA